MGKGTVGSDISQQLIGDFHHRKGISPHVSAWRLVFATALVLTTILILPPIRLWHRACRESPSVIDGVLRHTPLIDGHNDFPMALRFLFGNRIYREDFLNTTVLPGQVDFPRLRKGRLGAQFWSVWVSCPESTQDGSVQTFPDEIYREAIHDTLQQIDLVRRLTDAFPNDLISARTSSEIISNYRLNPRRISSLLGAEGLHQIGNSPSILRLYYSLGVRYVTLTHFCNNKYADSANQPPRWNGLSEDGKAIIKEMNRIGMIVDLSHTSHDTMRQALDSTEVPVVFSHASAFSVCSNPRNVPDDVLFKLKENRGVIMITFVNEYTNCEHPEEASMMNVADHIEHVGNLIGYQHVGIGSDFDGMLTAPKGLEDVSKYPALLSELVSRGLTSDQLKGVVGANFLRVLHEVEAAASQMKHMLPLEDVIDLAAI